MVVKIFECEECQTVGKIQVDSSEVGYVDLVYCPVCGSDIFEEEWDETEGEEDE